MRGRANNDKGASEEQETDRRVRGGKDKERCGTISPFTERERWEREERGGWGGAKASTREEHRKQIFREGEGGEGYGTHYIAATSTDNRGRQTEKQASTSLKQEVSMIVYTQPVAALEKALELDRTKPWD